jgi:hypothetical protein
VPALPDAIDHRAGLHRMGDRGEEHEEQAIRAGFPDGAADGNGSRGHRVAARIRPTRRICWNKQAMVGSQAAHVMTKR